MLVSEQTASSQQGQHGEPVQSHPSNGASPCAFAAASIKVETLKGTAMPSGFAQDMAEKQAAERIARNVNGVQPVRNDIVVRP